MCLPGSVNLVYYLASLNSQTCFVCTRRLLALSGPLLPGFSGRFQNAGWLGGSAHPVLLTLTSHRN